MPSLQCTGRSRKTGLHAVRRLAQFPGAPNETPSQRLRGEIARRAGAILGLGAGFRHESLVVISSCDFCFFHVSRT
jgi:hypothetical protein